MNKDHLYAFYGSLRRGMFHYMQFRHGLAYRFTEVLPGFRLYALAEYPYAIRSNNPGDTIVAEVFQATDPVIEKAVHDLELEVGYVYDEVTIRGRQTGIYRFDKQGPEPFVKGGDWVKFFGSK